MLALAEKTWDRRALVQPFEVGRLQLCVRTDQHELQCRYRCGQSAARNCGAFQSRPAARQARAAMSMRSLIGGVTEDLIRQITACACAAVGRT